MPTRGGHVAREQTRRGRALHLEDDRILRLRAAGGVAFRFGRSGAASLAGAREGRTCPNRQAAGMEGYGAKAAP